MNTVTAPAERSTRGEVKRVRSVLTDFDPLGEAGGEIIGEIEPLGVGDVALLVGQLGATLGVKALGRAVVDDPVRLQHPVLVIELDAADGGDRVVVLVVDELVGFDDELVGVARRRP